MPRDYVTGETIDTAFDLLRRSDLAAQLDDCRDFAQAVALAERLRLAPFPATSAAARATPHAAPSSWPCSTPMADTSADPCPRRPPARSRDPSAQFASATAEPSRPRRAQDAGGRHPLSHLSLPAGQGEGRHGRLRRPPTPPRHPPLEWKQIDLRLDANEAWTPDERGRRIRTLEAFGISAVEQPLPHAQAAVLRDVRRQVRTPIMLDESLCGRFDAERRRGTDLRSVQLASVEVRRIHPSLRLAQFAKQHGLGCQLGCQVGETAILSAAGRHFAASVAGLRYLEGSYDRHLVRESLATTD